MKISRALYIKLGEAGKWEESCLKDGTIRLGFNEVDHSQCLAKNWKSVSELYRSRGMKAGSSTQFETQVRYFYDEPETTVWFTFHADSLWWCTAKPQITLLEDGTKLRYVSHPWSNKDLKGDPLYMNTLSGKLLQTRGYRGTICEPTALEYLKRRINGEKLPEVTAARDCRDKIKHSLLPVIQSLTDKDFELLVDLIFRQGGWQRSGIVGGTEKTVDLSLFSPVTQELAAVQIKSRSSKAEFQSYVNNFATMSSYSKFFYVIHTGGEDLLNLEVPEELELKVVAGPELSDLVIRSGMIDWVLDKAG